MTTREFISRNFGVSGNEKSCSSVFKDTEGNIYSYGYHYPLLFTVDGHDFRNVTGYSNSTSKHIGWSRDVDAIDVHIPRGTRLHEITLKNIAMWQQQEIDRQRALMDKKKNKTTQVYRWMLNTMGILISNQEKVIEAIR